MSKFHRLLIGAALLAVVACSVWGLLPRWRLESADRTVAILVDFREIVPLARAAGIPVEEALSSLKEKGVTGLMVSELTGDDLSHGMGMAEVRPVRDPGMGVEGTEVAILPGAPQAPLLSAWLRLRLGAAPTGAAPEEAPVFLPVPANQLKTVGILPDVEGLEAAKKLGLSVYYRPAPTLGWLAPTAALMLRRVADAYPVAVFTPSGEIVSGYPDAGLMAAVSRERKLPVAVVEFSRQLGATALNALASPLLLSLHSVTNEEMMARNITRKALRERLIRAAVERSVRLLLLRTAPPNMADCTLDSFAEEVSELAKGLSGFKMGWPIPLFAAESWSFTLPCAWALVAVLLLTAGSFAARMGLNLKPSLGLAAAFLAGSAGLAFLLVKSPAAARLAGALAAPLIVTEASLAAMDLLDTPSSTLLGLAKGFLTAVAGGLALAAFFSVPPYMLRLQTFSGVKLTLMLPPLLVLLHDLKKRIHPESLGEILSRPPLWGELLLCGVLLAGLGLMVFRSGNVTFIPGFEARTREALERWLVARPRSKEVFLGYPSLLLLALCVRNGLWVRYRELLRLGVVLGFSSVVNSFCHFHTPLFLILLREFNGLWTGLLLGLLLVAAMRWLLLPLFKAARPLIE